MSNIANKNSLIEKFHVAVENLATLSGQQLIDCETNYNECNGCLMSNTVTWLAKIRGLVSGKIGTCKIGFSVIVVEDTHIRFTIKQYNIKIVIIL